MAVVSAELRAEAQRLGFELFGVCEAIRPPHIDAYRRWLDQGFNGSMRYLDDHFDLKSDPRRLLPDALRIIAVGLIYNQKVSTQPGEPRIARYALGRDYHRVMRGKLRRLKRWIETEHPGSHHRICVDSAPILERDFAQLAGLGWFGKNTLLINSERGSWFFIGLLLTSVPFEIDAPAVGGCGTCRTCIDACPTGAIIKVDERWQVDARQCISYLTIEHRGEIEPELVPKIGDWTVGCDVCQDVCPFNQPRDTQPLRATLSQEPDFTPRAWPSLVELAQISEASWSKLTEGSGTRRVGAEQLRRNARINLENLADFGDL